MTLYEGLLSTDNSIRERANKALDQFKDEAFSVCRKVIPVDLVKFLENEEDQNDESYYSGKTKDRLISQMFITLASTFLFSELN